MPNREFRFPPAMLALTLVLAAGCGDDPAGPAPGFEVLIEVVDAQGRPVPGLDLAVAPDTEYYGERALPPPRRQELPPTRLQAPFPSPFYPAVRVQFVLQQAAEVRVTVEDVEGLERRLLLEEMTAAGTYSLDWNGREEDGAIAPSGVYFASLVVTDADDGSMLLDDRQPMLLARMGVAAPASATDADGRPARRQAVVPNRPTSARSPARRERRRDRPDPTHADHALHPVRSADGATPAIRPRRDRLGEIPFRLGTAAVEAGEPPTAEPGAISARPEAGAARDPGTGAGSAGSGPGPAAALREAGARPAGVPGAFADLEHADPGLRVGIGGADDPVDGHGTESEKAVGEAEQVQDGADGGPLAGPVVFADERQPVERAAHDRQRARFGEHVQRVGAGRQQFPCGDAPLAEGRVGFAADDLHPAAPRRAHGSLASGRYSRGPGATAHPPRTSAAAAAARLARRADIPAPPEDFLHARLHGLVGRRQPAQRTGGIREQPARRCEVRGAEPLLAHPLQVPAAGLEEQFPGRRRPAAVRRRG
ncbi:MAG: hypothetical protein IPM94_15555 [bacterium]|nr:hypothetical protein [bacterium]